MLGSNLYTKYTVMFYLRSQAKSFSAQTIASSGISTVSWDFQYYAFVLLRLFCLPLNQILILTQIEHPNTFLFEATNLNIKGIFQRHPLPFLESQTIGKVRGVFGDLLFYQEVRKLKL